MWLSELLQNIYPISAVQDRMIHRLMLDSRNVQQHDLFIAIQGKQFDGCQYIQQALAQGAAAILYDANSRSFQKNSQHANQPIYAIHQLREKLGELAARYYDYPAKHLRMIGITGTNGKTSCSHYIAQILASENIRCGIIGTLGHGFCDHLQSGGLTTPDAISIQSILNEFRQQQTKTISMEVSSHSIDQARINAIDFEFAVFTNLTQDHLDYHGTMENYAAVKKSFLTTPHTKNIIINIDDAYGRKWVEELKYLKPIYGFGFKDKQSKSSFPQTRASQIQCSLSGLKAHIESPWGSGWLETPLIGEFNLSNVLATLTTLCVYGIPFAQVLKDFAQLKSVPGRMQTICRNAKPMVVIDYSHTPDALAKALQILRYHTVGRLICVFGCGGDRDPSKRPQMAAIAENYADDVIVTNDNPRHEKPEAIVQQIVLGFARPDRVIIELNRVKAIQKSIQLATAQDCILIAGKGAENYQQVGDEKIPFNDAEIVQKSL